MTQRDRVWGGGVWQDRCSVGGSLLNAWNVLNENDKTQSEY